MNKHGTIQSIVTLRNGVTHGQIKKFLPSSNAEVIKITRAFTNEWIKNKEFYTSLLNEIPQHIKYLYISNMRSRRLEKFVKEQAPAQFWVFDQKKNLIRQRLSTTNVLVKQQLPFPPPAIMEPMPLLGSHLGPSPMQRGPSWSIKPLSLPPIMSSPLYSTPLNTITDPSDLSKRVSALEETFRLISQELKSLEEENNQLKENERRLKRKIDELETTSSVKQPTPQQPSQKRHYSIFQPSKNNPGADGFSVRFSPRQTGK